MKGITCATTIISIVVLGWNVDAFSSVSRTLFGRHHQQRLSMSEKDEEPLISTIDVVKTVAVTGATGKTGKLVVDELLDRGVRVIGLVRNDTKAEVMFGSDYAEKKLEFKNCNLADPEDIASALKGCDATIWCATGFSDDGSSAPMPPTVTMTPEQSIDVIGVPAVAAAMLQESSEQQQYPNVVMLSSAGITRLGWDDAKKEKLKGCAEIPIVRLNPFGILGLKEESEKRLRETGASYCIVRPCGLNNNWPEGARPVVSQGDVAVGRINRVDLAKILCDVLSLPQATRKTFEVIGLAGYPPPVSIGPSLARLKTDDSPQGPTLTDVEVEASYAVCQQLLPGEKQDAAALAMGQTYEQLDKGETGRLGERGNENVGQAGIAPTSASAAA